MNVLLIDNNDSFTYNIADALGKMEGIETVIISSTKLSTGNLGNFDKFIISPGPGKPQDFLMLDQVIAYCINNKKGLLGICLGHQAICEYFGGELFQLDGVVHGQRKTIDIDTESTLYNQLPTKIVVGLYHSWAIGLKNLPSCLKVTGTDFENSLMSIEHTNHNIYGVQFHPESFMTEYGEQIVSNFLKE